MKTDLKKMEDAVKMINISKEEAKNLLEKYFYGKDFDHSDVLASIFSVDAIVAFRNNSEIIDFPATLEGNVFISENLFLDFHKNFDQIKSYYLTSEIGAITENRILDLPWLVVMHEKQTGATRIGTGSYDLTFAYHADSGWLIDRFDIAIVEMVSIGDSPLLYKTMQDAASYPWFDLAQGQQLVSTIPAAQAVSQYLLTQVAKKSA